MLYYSLNHRSPKVDFKTAAINGLAPDNGLYYPENNPALDNTFIASLSQLSIPEIACQLLWPYVEGSMTWDVLDVICQEAFDFPIPLVKLNEQVWVLELFHGRTLAFKDVGARFMSRCLSHFFKDTKQKITVLVATSGDTGGAVADGFYQVPGVEVVILYPKGKVSAVQEQQLSALGANIHALRIDGNFDDCQSIVKQAFADSELRAHRFLTSANSINVARWLPQQLFYAAALREWKSSTPPVISVPSGNFGNICAGLLAQASGLPIHKFIAACNANKPVIEYLQKGQYEPTITIPTLSNAMDVGDPSNFMRIRELYQQDLKTMQQAVCGYSFSDEAVANCIKTTFEKSGYLLDPHGAIGYLGLMEYQKEHPGSTGIVCATAHPIKFYPVIEPIIQQAIELPDSIQTLMRQPAKPIDLPANYARVRNWLIDTKPI